VVPRVLADWVYDRVASVRYRLFGKREACRVPAPEERARFLDATIDQGA
jgi:predicted DCC family thiol-disulfide oxidoreductase YuxK